jgi:ribosomal protein L7/L12
MPGLQPHQVQQIHQLIHGGQKIQAIQVYREATGVSLAEAKQAVEEMAFLEGTKPPSGVRSYDDPVLESKIRSLLSKGRKIDAVKIYREEYGISLTQAQDAVNRIEASMPRDSARGLPYESAIGRDPFEDNSAANRQRVVLAAAIMAIFLCIVVAAFFLLAL